MVPPWMLECCEPAALLMNPYQSPQTPGESPRHSRGSAILRSLMLTLILMVPLNLLEAGGILDPRPNHSWTGAIGFPAGFLTYTANGWQSFHFGPFFMDLVLFGGLWAMLCSFTPAFRKSAANKPEN